MVRQITFKLWLVSLLFFLCSCSAALKKKEYNEKITCLNSPPSETAVLGKDEIQIRFQHGGHNDYLYASWKDKREKGNLYSHGLSEIVFLKKSHKFSKNSSLIPVQSCEKWKALLEQVKQRLAPEKAGYGVSIVLNYQELVLYRDEDNTVYLKKFKDIPSYIKVVGLLKENRIAAEIVKLLENEAASGSSRFLFRTDNIYHGGIAFVFIDTGKKQSIFLTTPYHPEYVFSPGSNPLVYMARWFYRSGIVTVVKNPVTTMYRLYCRLKHSAAVILTGSEKSKIKPLLASNARSMDLEEWENTLDRRFPKNKPFKGKVEFLIDGEKFFPRLIENLQNAEKSIWLRTYIFDNDDYAVKIADILKSKSQDIKVRVLADHMGCMSAAGSLPASPIPPEFEFPYDIFNYLKKDSKIKVRATTNPWFTADHNKSIIVDGNTAYLGGMNIGREYRYEWHDLMMEVKGPIVGRLKRDFKLAWSHAGPFGDLGYIVSGASSKKAELAEESPELYDIRPLYTKSGSSQIFDAQLEAIRNAKKYIYIQNPYFTENKILNELILARGRGVDVRVILPSTSNHGIMDSSNVVTTNVMIENGIRVYHYPNKSHIKAAIYDGWACLGTANFDALSLRINLETNLAFSNPAAVETLKEELFEKDFSVSREITIPVKVTFKDYLGEMISNQL